MSLTHHFLPPNRAKLSWVPCTIFYRPRLHFHSISHEITGKLPVKVEQIDNSTLAILLLRLQSREYRNAGLPTHQECTFCHP
jgi:hypothetical protein